MEGILRLQINISALVVIAILWLSGDRRRTPKRDVERRLYKALLLSTSAMLFLDFIAWQFDGKAGAISRYAIQLINVLYYIGHTIPTAVFVLYADYQIVIDEKRFLRLSLPLILIEAIVAFLAILSPFTGLLFSIDSGNHYVRGYWFPIFAVIQYGLVGYILARILSSRKRVKKRVYFTLLVYPVTMLVAAILQMLFYGLVLIWPTMALFLIVSALNIENRRAKTDYLTGTANRRSLDEELERRIELAKTGRTLFGLLLDIDEFKRINDQFGHEAGDRALEDVASILLGSVRVEDHVARMGGDEFVVLVDFSEPRSEEELIRRIEAGIESLNASKRRPYRISLSIGRSVYNQDEGGTASDYLAALDADMYKRKRDRKSQD